MVSVRLVYRVARSTRVGRGSTSGVVAMTNTRFRENSLHNGTRVETNDLLRKIGLTLQEIRDRLPERSLQQRVLDERIAVASRTFREVSGRQITRAWWMRWWR